MGAAGRLIILAGAAALACSGGTASQPPSAPPPPPAPAPPPPTGPPAPPPPDTGPPAPAPLVIDAPAGAPAPWLQAPLPAGTPPFEPLQRPRAVGWGARSIVATDPAADAPAWYGVDGTRGAVGPLDAVADTVWIGIGGRPEQVFLATGDGTLLAAHDLVSAARPGGAVRVASFPGATAWTAAPGIVAVGHGDQVSVSRDGQHFRSKVVAKGWQVFALAARHDGALVANARPPAPPPNSYSDGRDTFVSRAGDHWARSRFRAHELEQDGAWITDSHPCDPAVLATGTLRWVQIGQRAAATGVREMTELLAPSPTGALLDPRTAHRNALRPPPPLFDPRREARNRPGDCGGGRGFGIGHAGRPFPGQDGLRRLRGGAGTPAPRTDSDVALLGDGLCKVGVAGCVDGATPARAPHVLVWNRSLHRARVLEAPPGCLAPALATAAGGLALLHCIGGATTTLYALAPDAWMNGASPTWLAEATIASPSDGFSSVALAADGTLLLAHHCTAAGCLAWIRAPRPAGDATAWRALTGGDVYRVLPGGAALVLTGSSPAGDTATFAIDLDRPDQPRRRLADAIAVDHLITRFEIENGTAVVDFDGGGRSILAADGTLLPAAP